jgi:hypothetical protein
MNYPENKPTSDETSGAITEAEIVKQTYELKGIDIRARHLMAHEALIARPEEIDKLGRLLTRDNFEADNPS